MFAHILVPTDGSAPSQRAARLAVRLARGSRARITVLHVVMPFKPLYPADYMAGAAAYPELYSPAAYNRITRAQGERILAKVARDASAAKVKCDTAIVYADPEWKAILSAARSKGCDLIVMGTHGRRGLEAILLGSVTNKVLTHSRKPVLTCR